MFYLQPQWQCELTGRQHLTYEQALESERAYCYRAEFQFCEPLRKRILRRLQFQTVRLDSLVEDIYTYFRFNFAVGEIAHCILGDQTYLARIIDILPNMENGTYQAPPVKKTKHKIASIETSSDTTESDDDAIPRQPNGRLRFPDAFLHPTPTTSIQHNDQDLLMDEEERIPDETSDADIPQAQVSLRYRVQLINEQGEAIENCVRIVEGDEIKRDKRSFCRHVLQQFIRECAHKDSYVGAPWIVKMNIARQYGIDNTLPPNLQEAQDLAYAKTRKRKAKTIDEKEAEKRARREETLLQKAKIKEEKERQREAKRKQTTIKYPIEDLDLPIYRKDPNMNWLLVDMSSEKCPTDDVRIPYPSGGRPPRPIPHDDCTMPYDLFDKMLSIWSFLAIFSEPLQLTPFSIDEFQRALFHTSHQPKATIMIESNVCLLNVIINERREDIANEIASGNAVEDYLDALEEDPERNGKMHTEDDSSSALSRLRRTKVERGWRDAEQLKIGDNWDAKDICAGHDRKGWETALIGCLNEVATPELIPNLDQILRHLVPRNNSTIAERERQYPTLNVKYKLAILEFLINVVNESTLIKEYMEQCQEQLTEFRRQKVEINKESKSLAARRIELDRRDREEKQDKEESSEEEEEEDTEESGSSDDSDEESANSADSDSSSHRLKGHERRHLSRQEKLKQKQKQREEMEAMRKKMYEKQREAVKAKNQEMRQKAEERRKLEEEEKALRKREEQLEKDMRKYMTMRVRPLGRDRFYNRYFYLDNIGTSDTYGTGRLYVQSPSDVDILMLMEREQVEEPEHPWDGDGDQQFILELMKAQGLTEECEWLSQRMEDLRNDPSEPYKGWWKCYSEPEEIQELLLWLNPKGSREYKLRNELTKQHHNIEESMKKRAQVD
ncbi:hypothetical protein EC973_008963 [Apophysomyces ossiformis]|uniref:DDT domain-containing protein n=1 Tax=Apophysomyces ossiformis TaxID=679940 RepID=A0A8H7ETB3_9FUNG|nr:hypothetical protein EC973_008963 [Apophysomyces ossiformis]